MIKVINIKSGEPYDIYVGRGTIYGNPYSHIPGYGKWPVETREDAIRLYEEWVISQPELIEKIKKDLKNKILACHCVPLSCHAEVLVKIANS